MPFEADLADALDRTTDHLDPDLSALVGQALNRGRRRRLRRRIGAGAGICAVLTATALVVPEVLAGTRSAGSDMETVALATPRSAITGKQMSDTLKKTFPGARFSQVTGQSNNPSDPSGGYVANGGLVVDDGHGPSSVGVSALRLKLPFADADGLSCEQEQTPPRAEGDTCEMKELPSSTALPGGALVMSERIAERQPAGAGTAHRWTVTLTVKSTGAQLQLVQWNTAGPFEATTAPKPTRSAPPLSEQQAVDALTGAVWSTVRGAVA
ncbi:hypothetical protein ACFYVL_08730 [Streptomyces sp. NPDC004111]|uniref:hypothetical protein n=1 Tax=Streptomyces sp. NPDC004111 TaxID=3364690 RepID=UPI003687A4EC